MAGPYFTEWKGKIYKRLLKARRRDKRRSNRYLDHTREFFGRLIAVLRQGTEHIKVIQEFDRRL